MIILLILLLKIVPSYAQLYNGMSLSGQATDTAIGFRQFIHLNDSINATLPASGSEEEGSSSYAMFKLFWANRLDENGKFTGYSKALHNMITGTETRCAASAALPSNWGLVGPKTYTTSHMGRMLDITIKSLSPPVYFAGSASGGVWRKKDGDWENVSDASNISMLGVSRIYINKTNTNYMYATTYISNTYMGGTYTLGVIKSTDGGDNWSIDTELNDLIRSTEGGILSGLIGPINIGITKFEIKMIYVPTTNIFLAYTKNRIYKKNGTGAWALHKTFTNNYTIKDIIIDPNHPTNTWYVAASKSDGFACMYSAELKNYEQNYILVTKNANSTSPTYTPVNLGAPSEICSNDMKLSFSNNNLFIYIQRNAFIINPDDATKCIVATPLPSATILKYDASNAYTTGVLGTLAFNIPCSITGISNIIVSTANDNIIYITKMQSMSSCLNRLTKSGATFTYTNLHGSNHPDARDLDIQTFTPTGTGDVIFLATDGGISRSTNGGASYTWLNEGLAVSGFISMEVSESEKDYYLGSAVDGNTFYHRNNVWHQFQNGDDFESYLHESEKDKCLYLANGGGATFGCTPYYINTNTDSNFITTQRTPEYDPALMMTIKEKNQQDTQSMYVLKPYASDPMYDTIYEPGLDIYKKYKLDDVIYDNHSKSYKNDIKRNKMYGDYTDKPINALDIASVPHQTLGNRTVSVYSIHEHANWIWDGPTVDGYISPIDPSTPLTDAQKTSNSKFHKLMLTQWDESNPLKKQYITKNITPGVPNWAGLGGIWNQEIHAIAINKNNPKKIFIGFNGAVNDSSFTGQQADKIYYTPDGGTTWQNISQGLPLFPVLDLEFWQGTSNKVFASTDVGVYVWNQTGENVAGIVSGQWECFSTNLPHCIMNDLEINYCTNTLYASAYGRGIWRSPLPVLPIEQKVPLTIGMNTTWNQSFDVRQNILIKSGVTLTINGVHNTASNTNSVEIRMPKDAQIHIEKGGHLKLNGATITNNCEMWYGIRVFGSSTQDQTATQQGTLTMINGAILQNAQNAISTIKVQTWGNDITATGGRLLISNSSFINNGRDVEFMKYHRPSATPAAELPNVSYFKNCTFETNDRYLGTTPINSAHITMWEVNGVHILGCTFEDKRTASNTCQTHSGIFTIDAAFTVNELCTSPSVTLIPPPTCNGDRSQFIKLKYGVQAISNLNPKFTVQVNNSDFIDTYEGVYLKSITTPRVTLNSFMLKGKTCADPSNPTSYTGLFSYGIYLDYCKGYRVEQNTIQGDALTATGSMFNASFGILIKNEHGNNEEIYKNTLTNLTMGIEAIGKNKDASTLAGLQLRCNNFSNCKYDIWVGDNYFNQHPNIDDIGIATNQGYPTTVGAALANNLLAGNLFSNETFNYKNLRNEGDYVYYYHHNDAITPRVRPTNYDFTSSVGLVPQAFVYASTLSCPSKLYNKPTYTDVVTVKDEVFNVIQGKISVLDNLVDNGDTEGMLEDVDATTPSNVMQRYYQMMAIAPYLSDSTLLTLASDEGAYTNAMIRNLLMACPQAAKNEKIQAALDARSSPLPLYMRNQINTCYTIVSAKENKDLELLGLAQRYDANINEALWSASDDSTDQSTAVLQVLNDPRSLYTQLTRIEWLDAANLTNQADSLMSWVIDQTNTNNNYSEYVNDYVYIRNLAKASKANTMRLDSLPSSTLITLQQMANHSNAAAGVAQAWLMLNQSNAYSEPMILPSETPNRLIAPLQGVEPLDPSDDYLALSPNPASDFINIRYQCIKPFKTALIQLSTLKGDVRISKNVNAIQDELLINTKNLNAGVYLVHLSIDGVNYKTEKLIIAK